jgi:hypothetical protein
MSSVPSTGTGWVTVVPGSTDLSDSQAQEQASLLLCL